MAKGNAGTLSWNALVKERHPRDGVMHGIGTVVGLRDLEMARL
jgi:hypothetical protein